MAKIVPLPSQALLLGILRYDAETGLLFWRERTPEMFSEGQISAASKCNRWNARHAGKPAFLTVRSGYLMSHVNGKPCLAHRVIWKMVTGEEPDQIDHIDGRRTHNVFENLRNVACVDNRRNVAMGRRNKSGHLGVIWRKREKKWYAYGVVSGGQKSLGYYHDKAEAIAARAKWQKEIGFHENHGRAA